MSSPDHEDDLGFGKERTPLQRGLLVAAGSVSLGLGILGVVLPLLPTTPFLLLSAACYLRSSRRLYRWLLSTRFPGSYIRDWRSGKGIPLGLKVSMFIIFVLTITSSAVFFVEALWVRILLGVVLVGVGTHILRLPTRPPAEKGSMARAEVTTDDKG